MNQYPQQYKWPAYVLVTTIAQFLFLLIIVVLPRVDVLLMLFGIVYIIVGVAGAIAFLGAFKGYYADARFLQSVQADYQPRSGLWMLGNLFIAPITALFYLSRREKRIGNDYRGTLLEHLPGISSTTQDIPDVEPANNTSNDDGAFEEIEGDTKNEYLNRFIESHDPGDIFTDVECRNQVHHGDQPKNEWWESVAKPALQNSESVEQADGTGRRWQINNE